MKNSYVALSLALGAILLPAAASAQASHDMHAMHGKAAEKEHHAASSGWKELDAFHTLLAATWHPVSKSNDLKPIREKAVALNDAAQAWAASKYPKACDTKASRDAVTTVASDSRRIADMVAKNAGDAEVKGALKELHTRFEVVEEGCKPSAK